MLYFSHKEVMCDNLQRLKFAPRLFLKELFKLYIVLINPIKLSTTDLYVSHSRAMI